MTPAQVRFRESSVDDLRTEYLFALGHICHVDTTRPLKLRDLFRLVQDIDHYIAEQKRASDQ